MQDDDEATHTAREDLCRFLAACYYEPGPEFAEEKLFDSMRDAAGRIDADLAASARRLGELFATEGHDNLLLDYTRLFLGPIQPLAKPYGSVWMSADSSLMGDTSMAVVELYDEGGFEIAEDFRELPDHIAAELEFLYLLNFRQNQARRTGDGQALETITALRDRFLAGHLGRWAGPFTAAVVAGAKSAFYRELAGLTARFVALQAAQKAAIDQPPG